MVHATNEEKSLLKMKGRAGIICFYTYWTILLCGKGLGYSSQEEVFRLFTWIAMLFAFIKLLTTHWDKQTDLLKYIGLNMLGILVWICSGDASILLTTITLTSLKDINLRALFKYSFWLKAIFFMIVTNMALQGMIDIQELGRYEEGINVKTRYGLGYGQPNVPQYTLFIITALCIISYHAKMKWWHYSGLLAYNYYIYTYTDSRTGLILAFGLILCCFVMDRYHWPYRLLNHSICKQAYIYGFLLSVVISILFAKIGILQALGTLSSRFGTGSDIILSKGINLFGTENISTDFGFINIMYGHGIITLFLFIGGMTLLLKRLIACHYGIEALVALFYAIYTLSEAYSNSVLMNVSLLLLVYIIYPQTKSGYTFRTSSKKYHI